MDPTTISVAAAANIAIDVVNYILRERNASQMTAEEREKASREFQRRSEDAVKAADAKVDALQKSPLA